MKQSVFQLLWCLAVVVISACGKGNETPEPPGPPPGNGGEEEVTVDNVSYSNFVGGLLQSRCSGCHTGSGAGTSRWVFSGYTSVRDNLTRINDVVVVRRVMPQNGSLSTRELDLLKAWINKGAPEN
ncbi:hypothetical protein SAMN05421747_101282 [Parapedobacter composti]|uniref:Cytochrome c domain-containing protein n=1 Tax=Parapedobacter composti TaxID=623281 RepID=A0A1I1E491_9SPHI|nr:hypothetical protein [Parapedobacter composti]SFB81472.1 hypothetical protein SAMN05421747_101282 [Parapedobacter composti]